jgi:hypothetical protein
VNYHRFVRVVHFFFTKNIRTSHRAEKERRRAKRQRREAAEKKATVYQVLTNPHKIRKMSKKQALRLTKVL